MKKEDIKVKFNKKAIIRNCVIVGIILVLLVLVNSPTILALVFGNSLSKNPTTITTDLSSGLDYGMYKNDIVVANSKGIKAYKTNGEYQWDYYAKLVKPFMNIRGNFIVLTDIEGSQATVLKNKEKSYVINAKQPIKYAYVNSNGYSVVISSEAGYKSLVNVYDKVGNNVYKWYSGQYNVFDAKIAGDNKRLAVLGLDVSGRKVNTVLTIFDIKKDKAIGEVILEDSLAYQLVYDGKYVNVLTDSSITSYDKYGKVKKHYDFEGRTVKAFDVDNANHMIVALDGAAAETDSAKSTEILSFGYSAKLLNSRTLPYDVEMVDENNGQTVCYSDGNVSVINQSGLVRFTDKIQKESSFIKISENHKYITVFSGSVANIFKIKLGR